MNIVDIVIIILLAFGAIEGFKAGVIKKTTDFVGMFVIVILAFYFKNDLSTIMYENLPFFSFGGFVKGIDSINILIYEIIAFLIIFALLLFVLKGLLVITGLIEKILKATVILSIPSKILGIFVGILESYVYIFIVLVILTLPIFNISLIRESKVSNFMLNNTPILSSLSDEMVDIYGNVYGIIVNREGKSNEDINTEVTKFMIDKNVLTKESARKLVDRNKLHINDNSILEQEDIFMSLIHYENDFKALISDKAIVDFYANWCGPCKMFSPVFEEVSNNNCINFVKVDVDSHSEIAREYGVMSIPTVILFENGAEVKRYTGFMNKDELIDFLKQFL